MLNPKPVADGAKSLYLIKKINPLNQETCIKLDSLADFRKNVPWTPEVEFSNDGRILAGNYCNTKLWDSFKDDQ